MLAAAVTSLQSAPIPLLTGWGGRDRTYECRNQNPVPYHLATPQGKPFARGNINVRQTNTAGGGSAREPQIRPFLRRFHRRFRRCLPSAASAKSLAARRIRKRKRRTRSLPIR